MGGIKAVKFISPTIIMLSISLDTTDWSEIGW